MRRGSGKKKKPVNYKKKADEVWSKLIRRIGYCEARERGNCAGVLNAAHVIRRGKNSVRHDLRNGISLCVAHHYWFDKGDRYETTHWFESKWPGRYAELHANNRIVHYKAHDWQAIYEELKQKWEEVNENRTV